jgi:hypothetical protein
MSMFERDDWTLFRNLATISQKAGVALKDLRALILKELMDNALDAAPGKKPRFGESNGFYYIEDDGPGIPGTPEEIAQLFSFHRPLTSSKMLRAPSRGALGNGLRVVAGAVLSSEGMLRVITNGHALDLQVQDDGHTVITSDVAVGTKGTRIEIRLGDAVPATRDPWIWATLAANFHFARIYAGRTSPFWYDSDSFYELCLAARSMALDELLKNFTTFGGKRDAAAGFLRDIGVSGSTSLLNREGADRILSALRERDKPVAPKAMGAMDMDSVSDAGYAKSFGTLLIKPSRGKLSAELPFVIEAVSTKRDAERDTLIPMVNGTPIVGHMDIYRDGKANVNVFGCGLSHKFSVSKQHFTMVLNCIIPYMPITTDGKEPDFSRFFESVNEVLAKSSKRLKKELRIHSVSDAATQAEILGRHLTEAIAKASDNGKLRFNLRQLYYALRPYVLEEAPEGKQSLDYKYFSKWITDYEALHGEIAGMYRDPRGTLYHPHTHETISIGTIAVEEYRRPEWTFRNVLYVEKEGLYEVLKQVKFPERYDCALLSSKGYASRAVRDLIDMLGEDGVEDVKFFAIHDADGPGTMIYQTLTEATTAREGRTVTVHNLGLDPWEAVAMGLQVEEFEARKARTPVARYVERHRADMDLEFDPDAEMSVDQDGYEWERWLQTKRVELNSMTSRQFVEWLERKFEEHGVEKVIPPEDVAADRLRAAAEGSYRANLSEQILKEAGFEDQVRAKMVEVKKKSYLQDPSRLITFIKEKLKESPALHWSQPVVTLGEELGCLSKGEKE